MDNPNFNSSIRSSFEKSTDIKMIKFRPTSWSCIEGYKELNRNRHPCGIFGYTDQGLTIYVKIVPPTIHLIEYSVDVTDQTLLELSAQFEPESIGRSENNPKAVILSNPIISPQQIESAENYNRNLSESSTTSVISTWNKSVSNPYGFLSSLFALKRLSPYVWMKVVNYTFLKRRYTIADIEISTHYNHLYYSNGNDIIYPSRFYWDLEVFSGTGEFPEAGNPDDAIFMGSGSHRLANGKNDYLFHLKKLNPIRREKNPQPIVIEMKNEEQLIRNVIYINRTLKIDRSYTYNGYSFDSPYLAKRFNLLKMSAPSSGKIRETKRVFTRKTYMGFFRKEFGFSIFLPGIEQLDLLPFFRKFYPGLPNYKLDTVGKKFLGVGKTGLTIPELNKFYQEGDPEGLKVGGEYALQDSILLADLQDGLKIDLQLEQLANQVGITTEDILRFSEQEIVDRYIYQLDPGLYFKRGKSDISPHLSPVKSGLYQPVVYIYDYSPLYIRALIESKNTLNTNIATGLSSAYPALIYKMFYSRVIDRTSIDKLLAQYLFDLHSNGIFARTEYLIYSVIPLTQLKNMSPVGKQNMIKLINTYKGFLSISAINYIILDNNNDMVKYGPSDISNPPYLFAKDIIDRHLKYLFKIGPPVKDISFGSHIPLEQLILTTKIKDVTAYKGSGFRKILSEQFGQKITTWIEVEWVHTNYGPLLLSKFKKQPKPSFTITTTGKIKQILPTAKIDYYQYGDSLIKILKKIEKLQIYRSPKPIISKNQ